MTNNENTSESESLRDELTERGREVWLAGLGALATVEEEGSKLFNELVERGQTYEDERQTELKKASEKVSEQRDKALEQLEEAGEETRSALANTVNSALERFGVPSRTEVDRLAEKVDTLSRQVEDLADALSEETSEYSSDEV